MITLHHVQYGRSFRILWLLEEIGIERFGGLDLVEYQIGTKEMRESGLKRLSPALRIPVIEYDGLVMSESGAIVEYLSERFAPDLTRGAGHRERAAYLQWLHYAETQASLIEHLNLQMVFLRPPARPSPVVVKLDQARLRQALAGVEARMTHDWLLEGGFSGADIMYGFNLFAARYYVDMSQFPALQAYWQRLKARPAFARAVAREGEQRFYEQDFYPVPES